MLAAATCITPDALKSHRGYELLKAQSPNAYDCHVLPCNDAAALQPFGALGGAPLLMHLLLVKCIAGRLNTAYGIEHVQKAHFLVFAHAPCKAEDGEIAAVDPVIDTVQSWLRVDAAEDKEAALPGFTEAYTAVPRATPAWYNTNSSGIYGERYSAVYAALHEKQKVVAAVERLVTSREALPTTSVCAFATVEIEKAEPGWGLRYLTPLEWQTAMLWSCTQWRAELKMTGKTPGNVGPQVVAMSKALLAQRAVLDEARCSKLLAEGLKAPAVPEEPAGGRWEVDTFLHLGVVVGHMTRPGSGSAAIQRVCDVADEHGLPILLEALPFGLLVSFYARFGFYPVHWEHASVKPFSEAQLSKQGVVYMWRPAKAQPAETPVHHPSLREQIKSMVFVPPTDTQSEGRRQFRLDRTKSKLTDYHLSVETERVSYDQLAWSKKTNDGSVILPHSWALEVLRLLSAGTWPASPYTLPPVPELVVAPTPTASALSGASSSRKRPSSSTPGPSRATRPQQPSAEDEDEEEDGPVPLTREYGTQTSPVRPMPISPGRMPAIYNNHGTVNYYVYYIQGNTGLPAAGAVSHVALQSLADSVLGPAAGSSTAAAGGATRRR